MFDKAEFLRRIENAKGLPWDLMEEYLSVLKEGGVEIPVHDDGEDRSIDWYKLAQADEVASALLMKWQQS